MYNENIFTKILNREVESQLVLENDFCLVIKDIAPQAITHLLVLSKGKYTELKDFLTYGSSEEILGYFRSIQFILSKLNSAKVQFNIGEDAGQEVMHLHAHIISQDDFNID